MSAVEDPDLGEGERVVPWLEHRDAEDEAPVRIPLLHTPFRIGRGPECDFVVHSTKVSKAHAEILLRRSTWIVRDLGSRNGTFVNGERIADARRLRHGDVVHVANKSFSFRSRGAGERHDATLMQTSSGGELAGVRDLVRTLVERRVYAVFQPIVGIRDGIVRAYECLGRSDLHADRVDGARGIVEAFRAASEQGKATELSRLLREVQAADAARLPEDVRLFFNVHPSELREPGQIEGLAGFAATVAPRRTVIEIHENSITDLAAMGRLREQLREHALELAYDDFGAGQSRLMELAEVPPDFIKLDLSIVRGIDASKPRRDLVAALTGVMKDLGIQVLAEGIETEEERAACEEIGCELAQGFLFGRPARIDELQPTLP